MGTKTKTERLTQAKRDERDDRILRLHQSHGLSVTEIAHAEGIHKSSVTRSLRRTHARWQSGADPIDIGAILRGSLGRLQSISDQAMREAFLESADRRTKLLAFRVATVTEAVDAVRTRHVERGHAVARP